MKNNEVTILIVEDSPTQAERMRYILEASDYRITMMHNGKTALEYLNDHVPTLIISDILMPELDGYDLCSIIKSDERLRHIPVILLSTLTDPEDIIRGLQCGADNFITKPYEDQFLLSRINYLLMNIEIRMLPMTEMGIEIVFGGQKHFITSNSIQILDLLLSTFETTIEKNRELERVNQELRKANETINTLQGLIPICAKCKKIRDDEGYWHQIEEYFTRHSEAQFSHGFCPDCMKALYPEYYDRIMKENLNP